MKPLGRLALGSIAAFAATLCLAGAQPTIQGIEAQAAKDAATPEGKAYLEEFFTNPWRVAFDTADERCIGAQSADPPHDELIFALTIGSNGYPSEALASPANAWTTCFVGQLKTIAFLKPPHDDFAIYMPFRETEPGTEAHAPQQPTNDGASR